MAPRTRGDFNAAIFFCHSLLLRVVPSLKVTGVSAVGWLSAFLYFLRFSQLFRRRDRYRNAVQRDNGDKRRKKGGEGSLVSAEKWKKWKNCKRTVAKIRTFDFTVNAIFKIFSSKGGGECFTNSNRHYFLHSKKSSFFLLSSGRRSVCYVTTTEVRFTFTERRINFNYSAKPGWRSRSRRHFLFLRWYWNEVWNERS